MKKVLLTVIVLFVAQFGFSQHSAGDLNLNLGVGLGGAYSLPVGISAEYGINDMISFGAYAGYAQQTTTFGVATFKSNVILAGARGAYHHDFDVENLDAYGGVLLGYALVSANSNNAAARTASAGSFTWAGFIGARYRFTDNIGAFGELGYGISILQIGLNLKF